MGSLPVLSVFGHVILPLQTGFANERQLRQWQHARQLASIVGATITPKLTLPFWNSIVAVTDSSRSGADMEQLVTVLQSLWQIVLAVWDLIVQVLLLAMSWSLLIAWVAWWIGGVNWKRTWPVLSRGAWAPLVLLMLVSALVWSRIAPSEMSLGLAAVPNFWWQLGAAGLLVAITLFCGWLQGIFGWTPPEISLEPPVHDPSHGHAHGHR